ncbi:hypothetical protein PsYK624_029330 [Phanerochaete sordida]|uniref:Uncharacterized protein n=1 Tax=Phanerochaete sordida TaxID=48140 RepID=A0A9P3G396_9APHY|nr:hypothetical protein PsYK624_029330 [Phanerochaete sordida]
MAGSYGADDMPPLTCNNLDQCQRARLIRSTRKLGAVLGTTPRLAEVAECPFEKPKTGSQTKGVRRHASVFALFPDVAPFSPARSSRDSMYTASSTNSSVVSLVAAPRTSLDVCTAPAPASKPAKGRRSAEGPRPLVLRINSVPISSCDTRVPLSPCVGAVPMSPSPSEGAEPPTEAEIRRKRMAKLTRTLGENIPPEMVFTPSHTRQAASVVITPPPRRSSRVWMTGSSNGAWTGEWNRKDIGEVQQKLRSLKSR